MMKELIARLKEFPMDGNRATYSRSLRIAALSVYDRPEDRATLTKDADWLLSSSMRGAYTYSRPPESTTRGSNQWDNSNSQYGALGVWAATDAGFRGPTRSGATSRHIGPMHRRNRAAGDTAPVRSRQRCR